MPTQSVYLNNAASGCPKAPGVTEAIVAAINGPRYAAGRSGDPRSECRERLARLLSLTDLDRIVLTTSATHALECAILGCGLSNGDRVVTTVAEHDSVLRPLNRLEVRGQIRLTIVGLDEAGSPDAVALRREIDNGARMVVINHVSNVTGRRCDVAPVFQYARAAGATTLLDASQSLGRIPVHPDDLCADLVALTGHKGLHGPSGTGALYVASHVRLDQAHTGVENGTPSTAAFAGLAAALKWSEEHRPELDSRLWEMGTLLWKRLQRIDDLAIFSSEDDARQSGIVSFQVPARGVAEVGFALENSFGIVCKTGLHWAPLMHRAIGSGREGTVRLSVSGLTTADDVEYTAEAVRTIASDEAPRLAA